MTLGVGLPGGTGIGTARNVYVLGPLAIAWSAYLEQLRQIAPPDLAGFIARDAAGARDPLQARRESRGTDPALDGIFDMRGAFDELLLAIEQELARFNGNASKAANASSRPAFETFEIRSGVATFSVSLGGGNHRVILRLDGNAYLSPRERERFMQEVELAKSFSSSHLHVTRILGGRFTSLGYPFVMQLVDGEAAPVRPPLSVAKVVDIGRRLADALDVAHRNGISFGVIEPAHILLNKNGDPLLTFPHLPMFAASGEGMQAAPRDVFSLCATLHSMLPQGTPEHTSHDGASLEVRVRELLGSGMRAEPELRPSAPVLREGFYQIFWDTAENWDDAEFPKRIPIPGRDGAPAAEIVVCIGDLFSESSDIVVSFSDTFDTDTDTTANPDQVIISPSSLQGQLARRVYDGDTAALDRDLDRALAAKPVTRTESREDKKFGKLRRYEIGTTAVLERSGRRIFAVAVSQMDNNLTAASSYESLEQSLRHLWREISTQGCASVAMPIIGSGLARVDASPYDLFKLIRSSFRARTQGRNVCPELRIVIHPSDADAIQSIGSALSAEGF